MAFEKIPLALDPVEQHLSGTVKLVKPRRSHCKSRNGCLHCKQRRVKCDERHPICGPCGKRQLLCSFQDQKNHNVPPAFLETSPRQSVSSLGSAPDELDIADEFLPNAYGSVRAMEMKLLHHYSTETYKSLITVPMDSDTLQLCVPELAFSYPFLMDAILNLSAQHLATIDKCNSKAWLRVSLQYQSRTLEKFTRILQMQQINTENCSAVTFCSILINISSIANLTNTADSSYSEWLYDFLSTRILNKGIKNILVNYRKELTCSGPLKQWFTFIFSSMADSNLSIQNYGQEYQLTQVQTSIYCDLMKSLGRLLNLIQKYPTPKQEVYITSCKLLAQTLSSQTKRGLSISVFSWPAIIDMDQMQPIESDIMSRAIILHYGVVLYLHNDRWYTHGVGLRMIKQILWDTDDKSFEELNSIIMWIRNLAES